MMTPDSHIINEKKKSKKHEERPRVEIPVFDPPKIQPEKEEKKEERVIQIQLWGD